MRLVFLYTAALSLVLAGCSTSGASDVSVSESELSLSYLDSITVPDGTAPFDVPFGGISGIDYDAESGRFLATSDDRSEKGPARFYELELPVDDSGKFGALDVTAMTVYFRSDGVPFPAKGVDPESIRHVPGSTDVLVSSEGDASKVLAPFISRFSGNGSFLRDYTIPAAYVPDVAGTNGVRNNLAFEGLTYSVDGSRITALTENALVQDGPGASVGEVSHSRAVVFDAGSGAVDAEYVYDIDPIGESYPDVVDATGYTLKADRGATEILAIDDTDYLVVERGLIPGRGNTVQVYRASTARASDVAGKSALDGGETSMAKTLLFDFAVTGENPDNVEGISWGPTLPDGTRTLVLCADDNFNAAGGQHTKFHLLAVR